ncbi:MAG: hypothetical protein ACYTBJ_26305 [Planctomycetota bacterium]
MTEKFDYNAAINESAQLMYNELQKPGNEDLIEAVKSVGSHDGAGGNFMFGFTWVDPNPTWGDEDYTKRITERNKVAPLNKSQTERWDAIVEIGDKHGHSGASYVFACRQLQTLLNQ